MVTGAKLKHTEEYTARLKAFTAYDESAPLREEEGFYSTCGQAFIRINR